MKDMPPHHHLKALSCNFTKNTLEDSLETTTDVGDEEEDDIDSCSTFSLQQCIDEFRARRVRRNSAHIFEQREDQVQQHQKEAAIAEKVSLGDAELINQNRSNKEHERKYKPCKNGFCYCFTSDSGEGGGCFGTASIITTRGATRYVRRSRKSESGQHTCSGIQQPVSSNRIKERRSAPACLKTNTLADDAAEMKQQKNSKSVEVSTNSRRPLTAVSRLKTTTHDAPLIHIIQELRDNCIVSEVRVNKQKLEKNRLPSKPSKHVAEKPKTQTQKTIQEPTAPPLEEAKNSKTIVESKLNTSMGNSIPVSRLEIKNKSPKRKPGAGRLLQKRLSQTNVQYKPWDMTEPPPKPPRTSAGSRLESSNSSLTTTTSPSIREAERIVDDFLTQKGIQIPRPKELFKKVESRTKNDKKHMSFAVALNDDHAHFPTCPSISDIERIVDKNPQRNYGKNIQQPKKQQVKDITFGWKESKVSEMLSYDSNGNRKEFKSQSAQAEPQSLGWKIPQKLELDTVDGAERHNLAANLETKDTPVKRQFDSNRKEQQTTYPKFGWRNLSPWRTVTTHGTRLYKCPKGTSSFLRQSKKKILRLVTPKKDNKEQHFLPRKNFPFRTVGIQTSSQDLASYANSSTPQSPPGSYHSAAQANSTPHQSSTASNNLPHSQSTNPSDSSQFDFTRKVNSPKKPTRTSQRKLNFPTVCGATSACFSQNSGPEMETTKIDDFPNSQRETLASRTYRSYQTGIDQDVTVSKMGAILSNIRARLEASDEHAVRTFEEIERREQLQQGFDFPDSHGIRQRTCVDIHSHINHPERGYIVHEPIYSEIEEDSIHVTESPQFDNKTGIESSCSASGGVDLETLYAKVNKPSKQKVSSVPLGQFLHDSLQRRQTSLPISNLPTLPEPSISNISYSSPPLETSMQHSDYDSPTPSLMHCQSMNNIRVMEHNSPPNHNRNISKSDLSLQRSEIFLENLCQSELIAEDGNLERLEKMDNLVANNNSDYISYDVPDEFENNNSGDKMKETVSNSTSSSPQKFLAKHFPHTSEKNADELLFSKQYKGPCSSCPVTPRKFTKSNQQKTQSNSQPTSLNNTISTETGTAFSAFARCKRIKQALQNSIRKGKNFVKSRRASLQLNFTQPIEEHLPKQFPEVSFQEDGSSLNIDSLFVIDDTVPVIEQIARAVSVCRQLPELEITHEMVEAERLLLFTTLRNDTKKQYKHKRLNKNPAEEGLKRNFTINAMRFPINIEPNLDDFFNYYFTVTFEIDDKIISTQSTECRCDEVVFQGCNIKFDTQKYQNECEPFIQCNIFMLRLRKVTTKRNDAKDTLNLISTESPDILPLCSTPLSSVSSLNGISSRFRLYGTFKIDAQTFKPFVSYDKDVAKTDMICLGASRTGSATIKLCTKRESVNTTISIDANVRAYFPKKVQSGFLHVQDPYSLHNWNRRWCILNGLQLEVWADMSCMSDTPLLRLNLFSCKQPLPLMACAQGLCARMRSFCLQCLTSKDGIDADTASIFFAAENEADLIQWIQYLNEALNFIKTWTQ